MKEKFIKLYKQKIQREGADKLLEWLCKTDFFVAPASTRFHGSEEGGLLKHSLNVYEMLSSSEFLQDINPESIAITSLLHDLCKVNFYKTEMRNYKNEETGKWEKVPYYTIDDQMPYGHGEKSVYIVSGFIKLTREESMAINWHMGGFDDRVKGGSYALGGAFEKYPLALELHIADMRATYQLEKSV